MVTGNPYIDTGGASWIFGAREGAANNRSAYKRLHFQSTAGSTMQDMGNDRFAIVGQFGPMASGSVEQAVFGMSASASQYLTVMHLSNTNSLSFFWRDGGDARADLAIPGTYSGDKHGVGTMCRFVAYRTGDPLSPLTNTLNCGILDAKTRSFAKGVPSIALNSSKTVATYDQLAIGSRSQGDVGYYAADAFGWFAVIHFPDNAAADPDAQDWESLLLDPDKILRLWHPNVAGVGDPVVRAWWGRLLRDGVEMDVDSPTERYSEIGVNTFTLEDIVGDGGDMELESDNPAGTATDFWVLPKFTASAFNGDMWTLSGFNGPRTVACSDGGRWVGVRYHNQQKDGAPAFSLEHINASGKRDRWGVPVIMGCKLITATPTVESYEDPFFRSQFVRTGQDYHVDIQITEDEATGKILAFQAGHSQNNNLTDTAEGFGVFFPCWSVHDPDNDTTFPAIVYNDLETSLLTSPTVTLGDYSLAVTTYGHICTAADGTQYLLTRRDGGTGGDLILVRMDTGDAKQLTSLGGSHQSKPIVTHIMPSGKPMLVYTDRYNAGSGGCYMGLRCIYVNDPAAITNIASYRNPIDGASLGAAYSQAQTANCPHTLGASPTTEDAAYGDCVFTENGDMWGCVGICESGTKYTSLFTDSGGLDALQVSPDYAEADQRFMFCRSGWNEAGPMWSSYDEWDISASLGGDRTEDPSWSVNTTYPVPADPIHTKNGTLAPDTDLGSMWFTPILQLVRPDLIALFYADPEGNDFEIDVEREKQRETGEVVKVAFWSTRKPDMGLFIPDDNEVYRRQTGQLSVKPIKHVKPGEVSTMACVQPLDLIFSATVDRGGGTYAFVDVAALASQASQHFGGGDRRGIRGIRGIRGA